MAKITQRLIFPEVFEKPVHCQFDEPHSSSDGGALLLTGADQKLQLTAALAACLVDARQTAKVKHTIADLLRQRIYGLASGYADANDAARLAQDPIFKLLLDRAPLDGPELSSQATLSRFENRIGPRENYRLGAALAQQVINRQRRRRRKAKRVTIDLDSTADPTHGQQELTFFNRHYDSYCYLPLLAFISFDDEPEQYLLTALLRPSNVTEKHPVIVGLLARLVEMLRAAFPQALINLRLDGGFACPALFDYLDSVPRLEYVCGLAKNAVLNRRAQPLLAQARKRQKQGRKPRLYGECRYRAQTWDHRRRVVIKAEIVHNFAGEAKDNPRFVVTNKPGCAGANGKMEHCRRGSTARLNQTPRGRRQTL
jgi:hypothetical protein